MAKRSFLRTIRALLGFSAYAAAPSNLPSLDDPRVEAAREQWGGNLAPMPQTRLRWYLADLERAMANADAGDLHMAAELAASLRRDAALAGILSTRTRGVINLERKWRGDEGLVSQLVGVDGDRAVFDAMCPAAELELLAADGVLLGVGVAELLPVEGRDYPVLVRLDPRWLVYRWAENRWYYRATVGLLPITPGDGRWVLHLDGGRVAPWQSGLWYALGQSWIDKQHARLHQANWEAKLANPARAAVAPLGATETERRGFLQRLIAWGINTVFELPVGWDVKIIESNGRGWESFTKTIERSEREYAIALAGQVVTITGGTGFANADVHRAIRADLIESTATALASTINSQIVPSFVWKRAPRLLDKSPALAFDITPPKDQKQDADAFSAFGEAVTTINQALAPYARRVDAIEMAKSYGIRLEEGTAPAATTPAPSPGDEGTTEAANDVDDLEADLEGWDVDLADLEEAA